MRFSSVFQPPAVPQHPAAPASEAAHADRKPGQQPTQVPGQDLPDELDARVRLVGEWQLGEAC